MMTSLGNHIRNLRTERKSSLREVSDYMGIDQAILSKIERGQRKANRDQVLKFAEYFNVDKDELLVNWLADKLIYDVQDEEMAIKALQLAEEQVAYRNYQKIDKNSYLNAMKNYFGGNQDVSKAWVFGSFARGDDDYKSDIDVMIEVPENSEFSLFDLAEIQYQLEKLLARKVDVVMKDGVKPQILERIKPDLKVVYER